MGIAKKAFAVCVMCAFIVPNLYSIILGQESFPFTPAPMFAHHIGEKTIFYDINFIGEADTAETQLYPALNTNEKQPGNFITMRFFLNKIYGSAESRSPLGYFEHDTKEDFEKRMAVFCSNYFKPSLTSDTTQLNKIRLEVNQYNRSYELQQKHVIGYYDVSSKNFTHTWKSNL